MKDYRFLIIFSLFVLLNVIGFSQTYNLSNLNKSEFSYKYVTSILQDYDGDGDLDIIVGQNNPNGIYWLENNSSKQFPKHPIISDLIENIYDVDTADLDDDGDIDYVVCQKKEQEIAWYQRQDDTTYIKYTIKTGEDFVMADVADFNGDGLIDIATVGDKCWVFFNNGDLLFADSIVAKDGCGAAVSAEDLDNDGDIDLAIGGSGVFEAGSRVILNDGTGFFTHAAWLATYTVNHHGIWQDIKTVDLNQDGICDVLGFGSYTLGGLFFFDGSDDFNVWLINREGVECGGGLVVFDIDGNGLPDIIGQEECDGVVYALYQTDTLTFKKEYIELQWSSGGSTISIMSSGDIDNDGDLDLVFPESGNISWFENIDGSLYRHFIYSQLQGVCITKTVDIDSDGDFDVLGTITEEDEIIAYENIDGTNFVNWRIHDSINYAVDIETSDIDNDGDIDFVVTSRDDNSLYWFENNGAIYDWTKHLIDDNVNSILGAATVDLNNDSYDDVIVCCFGDAKIFWYLNNGDGSFTQKIASSFLPSPRDIETGDFDNDSDLDICVVSADTGYTLTTLINTGDNQFSQNVIFSGVSGRDIEVGDWNKDNSIDIFGSAYEKSSSENPIIPMINDGTGLFNYTPLISGNCTSVGLKLGDIDNDNDIDIIYGYETSQLLLGRNDEDTVSIIELVDSNIGIIYGIDIADLNSDGNTDIVFADYSYDNLNVLFNKSASSDSSNTGSDSTLNPLAGFTCAPTSGDAPLTVSFTDTSQNNVSSWLWDFGDGTTSTNQNPTHTYSLDGSFTVSLIASGVNGTDTIVKNNLITVTALVGIENIIKDESVHIYPNPSDCFFNVEIPNNFVSIINYEVYNSSGQRILSETTQNSNWIINMQGHKKGLYMVRIYLNDKVIYKKVVLR